MNRAAAKLNLKNTNFTNPHGLSDKANHSSAFELARLCSHCMKNSPLFAELVSTKLHHAVTYLDVQRASNLFKLEPEKLESYIEKAPFQTGTPFKKTSNPSLTNLGE
jgi:hypothetical protein